MEEECPECGGELDSEYGICSECDWFDDGAGDLINDLNNDK